MLCAVIGEKRDEKRAWALTLRFFWSLTSCLPPQTLNLIRPRAPRRPGLSRQPRFHRVPRNDHPSIVRDANLVVCTRVPALQHLAFLIPSIRPQPAHSADASLRPEPKYLPTEDTSPHTSLPIIQRKRSSWHSVYQHDLELNTGCSGGLPDCLLFWPPPSPILDHPFLSLPSDR